MQKHALGRKPDTQTPHDLSLYKVVRRSPNLAFITNVDLSAGFPPVFDQGQLGSCTANALLGAYEFEMAKQKEVVVNLSRLFLYYQERLKEGTVNEDAGAAIEDGVWVLQKGPGVCNENLWPYKIEKFATPPSASANADAKNHKVVSAQRLAGTLLELKQVLVNGDPIVFGIEVYESFQSPLTDSTGVIPMPNPVVETLEGGHAIVLVGFDDTKQRFKFRNSWGTGWGDKGYGYIPYAYVTNPDLSSDFWVITSVHDTPQPVPPVPPTPTPPVPVQVGTFTSSVPLPPGTVITLN